MLCHNCSAEGPIYETKAEATAAWNRRTPAPAAGELPALTDDQIEQVWVMLPLTGAYNMGEARIKFARAVIAVDRLARGVPAVAGSVQQVTKLTEAEIDTIWRTMPGGPAGWLKSFGYLQFARAVEDWIIENGKAEGNEP